MIELALHKIREDITVQHVGHDNFRVHMGLDHSGSELRDALILSGQTHLIEEALALFSRDECEREFVLRDDFLLIKPISRL